MWSKTYSKKVQGLKAEQVWKIWTDLNQWHTWQSDIEYAKLEGEYLERMKLVGTHWTKNPQHGELLRNLTEIGGLSSVPDELLPEYLEWLVLCYIGESGGYGAGYGRKVFYSNVGGQLSLDILKAVDRPIAKVIAGFAKSSPKVKDALTNEHISRRYESILDTVQ